MSIPIDIDQSDEAVMADVMRSYEAVKDVQMGKPASQETVDAIREEDGVSLVDLSVSTVNQDGAEVVKGSATARIDD